MDHIFHVSKLFGSSTGSDGGKGGLAAAPLTLTAETAAMGGVVVVVVVEACSKIVANLNEG